jgi:serine protease inhibitor|tara:strand:- start:107 stop:340 length:234 start_codon:yes stop_codon:yes gene_type:complete
MKQSVTISTEVLDRLLDLVSNLKEICRVYHADNHKDLDSALHAFTEVENEIHKFAGKEGVSLDDILTNIGLTRHGEA